MNAKDIKLKYGDIEITIGEVENISVSELLQLAQAKILGKV